MVEFEFILDSYWINVAKKLRTVLWGVSSLNMEYGLFQEQTQKLVMTTQMKQAIEILQFSNQELNEYLVEAAEKNPLLDVQTPVQLVRGADGLRSPRHPRTVHSKRGEGTGAMTVIEQMASAEVSPIESLEAQLGFLRLREEVLQVAKFLVGSLDESGYLRETDATVAALMRVGEGVVEEARQALQQCDPPGIGARDLRECLLLQVPLLPEEDQSLASRLIERHLEDVAAGKLGQLAKRLKVSVLEVQAAVDQIKKLNPRPGLGLQIAKTQYIVPDVLVVQDNGEWVVAMNDTAYAKVQFNPEYYRMFKAAQRDRLVSLPQAANRAAAESYLTNRFQAAKWLMRCLEQRQATLFRVAQAIVSLQSEYFEFGPQAIKPLTLRQIAEGLGVHESTVSRATRGKYMQTPRGVIEMKYFFSAEVSGDGGGVSATSAKYLISQLIRDENPLQPLSDEALVSGLLNHGVRISRRTVAKYRDELGLLPSWRRKRFDVQG